MDLILNLALTVGGTFFGVAVSLGVEMYRSYRRYDAAPDISGDWRTEYQAAALSGNPWVREDATIRHRLGRLRFSTDHNSQKDEIEGELELVGLDHVLGRWRQVDARGKNHGVFVLTIAPTGRLMYGFWSGLTDAGERRFGAWVWCRDKRDLSQGKALLKQVTVRMSTATPGMEEAASPKVTSHPETPSEE